MISRSRLQAKINKLGLAYRICFFLRAAPLLLQCFYQNNNKLSPNASGNKDNASNPCIESALSQFFASVSLESPASQLLARSRTMFVDFPLHSKKYKKRSCAMLKSHFQFLKTKTKKNKKLNGTTRPIRKTLNRKRQAQRRNTMPTRKRKPRSKRNPACTIP